MILQVPSQRRRRTVAGNDSTCTSRRALRQRPGTEAGFSILVVILSLLILLTLGLSMIALMAEDSDLSVNHVQANQALFAAQAGTEYALKKLAANWAWGGLPSPGKAVGAGSFWVAPPDAVDESGSPLPAGRKRVIVTGTAGSAVREIQAHVSNGIISTFAGTGTAGYTGDGGQATAAQARQPEGVAVAANGDLYFADTGNHVIRKVSYVTRVISTVAGTGASGYTGDGGAATGAKLNAPQDVFVTSNGDVYIVDTGNHAVRKVTVATGIISTVAGTGSSGSSGDGGAATAAKLNSPRGIVCAANGDFYIGDRSNHKIRKVTAATGIISTFAGTGSSGYTGDGGAATAAKLNSPEGVELAGNGDLYIADTGNDVIRKVTASTGFISTFAGTSSGFSGDGGAATAAKLNGPEGLGLSPSSDLYIADTGNNRIRRVDGTGIISTTVGTGTAGSAGDGGLATSAQINSPRSTVADPSGAYYIADRSNHKIRKVTGLVSVVTWVETR